MEELTARLRRDLIISVVAWAGVATLLDWVAHRLVRP